MNHELSARGRMGFAGILGLGLLSLGYTSEAVELPLPCRENASNAAGRSLLQPCVAGEAGPGLSQTIIQRVDTLITRRVEGLASGLDYDMVLSRNPASEKTPARPYPTPSCNLLSASGPSGAQCGDLAKLEISGESLQVKLGNQRDGTAAGSREMAYLRGVYLQSLTCQKNAVLAEIRSSNRINVQAPSCARAVPRVQEDLQKFLTASGTLSASQVDLEGLNLACEDDSGSLSGGNQQHRQAGCQLKAAREMLEAQVAYLAACEISARAGDLYDRFPLNLARNPAGFETALRDGVYGIESLGQFCERAARNAAGLRCKEGCVENLVNRCYSGTREPAFERKGGIEVFFRDVMREYFRANRCETSEARIAERPVYAATPVYLIWLLLIIVAPLLGACGGGGNGRVSLTARCTSPSGEVMTGWRENVCCDPGQQVTREQQETLVQAYVTIWKFGPEDHDIAKIYFPSGSADGVETPLNFETLRNIHTPRPGQVEEYGHRLSLHSHISSDRPYVIFRRSNRQGPGPTIVPENIPATCRVSSTVAQNQWNQNHNWRENRPREGQVQLNTCGDACVTDPSARGSSFVPSVLASQSSIQCIAVTATVPVEFQELAYREPSPTVAQAKALAQSAGVRAPELENLADSAMACIDSNGSGDLFEGGISSAIDGLGDGARTAIELAQNYYDARSERADYSSPSTSSAATAMNGVGPGKGPSDSAIDPMSLLKNLDNFGSGGGGSAGRSPGSNSGSGLGSGSLGADTGTVTVGAIGEQDSNSESSAAYSGGGGGGKGRGKSGSSSLNPLGALSSLFGGKDGKGSSAANGAGLDFGAASGAQESGLMNSDADDYFARLSPDQNLFQVVHRRYRKENIRWVSSDIKKSE